MMKNVKNIKVWYLFMPRFTLHYDVEMVFFPLLDFSGNWIKRLSNLFDARVAQAPASFMLVGPLKTSSLYSVTAHI